MQTTALVPLPAYRVLSFSDAYGISWARGQFRVAARSPLRSSTRKAARLIALYSEAQPLPPTPEEVETLLLEIEDTVPAADLFNFVVQGVILRATAREYFAA